MPVAWSGTWWMQAGEALAWCVHVSSHCHGHGVWHALCQLQCPRLRPPPWPHGAIPKGAGVGKAICWVCEAGRLSWRHLTSPAC